MSVPGISVIMPIKGRAPFLRPALGSLARQSVKIDELIIVDDGIEGSDVDQALEDAASSFGRIRRIEGPRRGPAAARNAAISVAEGALIGFLDDDDLWPDDKLARQCALLERDAARQAAGGRIHWFSRWDEEGGQPIASPEDPRILHVNLGSYVFRRSLFDRIGALDEELLFAEDVDLLLRMIDADQPFALLDHVTLLYRRHANSMTAMKSEREVVDLRKVLFRSLRRRRQGGAATSLQRLSAYLVPDELPA